MHDMILKLDDLGRPAWIALMVLGFILFWPLGLAVLAFLLGSGRMGCGWHGERSRWQARWADKFERGKERFASEARAYASGYQPTGNKAFDEYREETLKRLEEESREFADFLERLRLAKDRAEFDQFMSDRKSRPAPPPAAREGFQSDQPKQG